MLANIINTFIFAKLISVGGGGSRRGDTISTNDNSTFKSVNISAFISSNASINEEAPKVPQGNIVLSKLEEIEENSEDQDNNSEEEKTPDNQGKAYSRGSSVSSSSNFESENSPVVTNINDVSMTKADSMNTDKSNNNRIKLPKLLVLVSKYPIYKDMEKFLK